MKKVNKAALISNQTPWYETSLYETLCIFFLALIFSAILLILCSPNSFLVGANTAFTLNTDWTVAKSLRAGLLPYEDLYATSGFLLYALYALASFLDIGSLSGVLILEIIAGAALMCMLYKIARLYVERIYAISCMLAPVALMIVSPAFKSMSGHVWLTLPFAAYALYAMILQLQNQKISPARMVSVGAAAGIAAQMASSLLLFFAVSMLFGLVYELVHKKWLSALMCLVWFCAGAAVPVLLVCFYYMYQGSVHSLIDQYYSLMAYNILHGDYSQGWKNLVTCLREFYVSSLLDLSSLSLLSAFSLLGLACIVYMRKISAELYVLTAAFSLCLCAGFYGSNGLSAFLPLGLFSVFGFIFAGWLLNLASDKLDKLEGFFGAFALILIIACTGCFYYLQKDWTDIFERSDNPAASLAKWIDESTDTSLIIYDGQDFGMYKYSGTLPDKYYFVSPQKDGYAYGQIVSVQQQYIESKSVQFVVCCYTLQDVPDTSVLAQGYTKLKTLESSMNGEDYIIELYSRNE